MAIGNSFIGMVHTITDANFEGEVLKAPGVTVVDFWAPWCGPCKIMGPIIDEMAQELTAVKFAKMNVDEQPEVPSKYQVMSIPTMIVYKGGKPVDQMIGVQDKASMKKKLEAFLK